MELTGCDELLELLAAADELAEDENLGHCRRACFLRQLLSQLRIAPEVERLERHTCLAQHRDRTLAVRAPAEGVDADRVLEVVSHGWILSRIDGDFGRH